MKRTELFNYIKEVNALEDKINSVVECSKEYYEIAEAISCMLDVLNMGYHPWYVVLKSRRTGHYYIKFAD